MAEVAGGGETARANPGEAHPGVVAPGYEWYAQAGTDTLLPLFSSRTAQMEAGAPRVTASIRPKLTETASVAAEAQALASLLVKLSSVPSVDGTVEATASIFPRVHVDAPRKITVAGYTRLIKDHGDWTEEDETDGSSWTEDPGPSGSWSTE